MVAESGRVGRRAFLQSVGGPAAGLALAGAGCKADAAPIEAAHAVAEGLEIV
jgi:hypothetical protein